MSEQGDIVLNEFGDLSRKARREMLAKGIDPDTAVIEYLNTQSIPIQRPAEAVVEVPTAPVAPTPAPAPSVPAPAPAPSVPASAPAPSVLTPASAADATSVPEVPFDGATTTAEVFPSMSKREVRSFLERTNPVPVIENDEPVSAPKLHIVESMEIIESDEEDVIVVDEVLVLEREPFVPVYDEIDGVEDEFGDEEEDEDDDAPTTIAEATAALALAEAIAAHNAARIDNGLDIDSAAALAVSDDVEPFSVGVSTSTGSIPTISNALILPTLPEDTGSIVPIATTTGEIMITESVSIPSSIATLGAHLESLDTSEVDILEDGQEIAPSSGLAPVSATTAVSSYNINNAVVTVPRRISDRLPLVLSLTAAGLAVAVVALFIAGYFLGIF